MMMAGKPPVVIERIPTGMRDSGLVLSLPLPGCVPCGGAAGVSSAFATWASFLRVCAARVEDSVVDVVYGGGGASQCHGALQLPKHQSPRVWHTATTRFGFCCEVLVQVTHWLVVKFTVGSTNPEQLYSFQVKSAVSSTAHGTGAR